jgi:LysM repeat protein
LAHIQKKEENACPLRNFFEFNLHWCPLVFKGMGFLFIVTVFSLLFGCGDKESKEDLSSIKSKLDRVERRITQLEGTGQKIARLETQIIKLEQTVAKLESSVTLSTDKRRHHVVRRGDSLSKIANRYGITVGELCRLNEITPNTVIRPGQKLLVWIANRDKIRNNKLSRIHNSS